MGRTSDLSNSTVWLVALPDGVKKSVLVQSRVKQRKLEVKYRLGVVSDLYFVLLCDHEKGIRRKRVVLMLLCYYLPAEAPIAPIRTAGIAISKHPNEAARERPLALAAVLQDSTRWK